MSRLILSEVSGVILKNMDGYDCEICVKTFANKHYLKRHTKLIHEQVKKHKCDLCDKDFESKKHIQVVHERVKDFKCDTCEMRFGLLSYLKRHSKTVHKTEKEFKCESCDKSFGNIFILSDPIKMFMRARKTINVIHVTKDMQLNSL